MNATDFLRLQEGKAASVPFSQIDFRKQYLPGHRQPLCAGLVGFWLHTLSRGEDAFPILQAPDRAFLLQLTKDQEWSRYPSVPAGSFPSLSDDDRSWLREKYGTDVWPELIQLLEEAGASDFLSYDLLKTLGAGKVHTAEYNAATAGFFEALTFPAFDHCMQVLVIRYARLVNGKPARRSHRIGFFHRSGQWHFFDPNAGNITFSDPSEAAKWLKRFWDRASYRKYKSSGNTPLLSIYTVFDFPETAAPTEHK